MKIIAFDLDDVLCSRDKRFESLGPNKYQYCFPIQKNIGLMNALYDKGYYIKIYTARGMTQFKGDYDLVIEKLLDLTTQQLKDWNTKYHELIFGKTHYDLLIDDKVKNIYDINNIEQIEKWLSKKD